MKHPALHCMGAALLLSGPAEAADRVADPSVCLKSVKFAVPASDTVKYSGPGISPIGVHHLAPSLIKDAPKAAFEPDVVLKY